MKADPASSSINGRRLKSGSPHRAYFRFPAGSKETPVTRPQPPRIEPDKMMRPDASALVVIPCLNEADHLPSLLAMLSRDSACGHIIVTDGGSRDGSRDIVIAAARQDARVTLLDNPKRLQGAGLNLAVAHFGSFHDWLVRIDAHCQYPEGYVSALLNAANLTGAGSVVVPMVTQATGGCFQRGVAAAQNSVLGTGGSAHRHVGAGKWVEHGHHALMRVADFASSGGYCEHFPANEDAELDIRMARNGTRIWLEPSLAITYFPRRTGRDLWRQYYRYGRGRAMTVRRHRPRLRLRQILPLAVLPAAIAALFAPVFPTASALLAVPVLAWALLVIFLGTLLAARNRSACTLWAGAAAMIMHAAWSAGFWSEWMRLKRMPPPPQALNSLPPEAVQ